MADSIDPNFVIDAIEALDVPRDKFVPLGKTKPGDYRVVRTLAKGGYGEVYIVERGGSVYAMKKVPKDLVRKNPNTTFFMNEKEIMTTARSEWLVRCHSAIQDAAFLYYIMDFIPGGDLMCYLSRMDIVEEDAIRFYAAEIFTAIDGMHALGWIHRDLKPENILLDASGHVKLADFGSCIRMVDGRAESSLTVGTPDYLSPDLLVSMGETVRYGCEVDFWTVGVIIYEMLYGTTPFYSESLKETYRKIESFEVEYPEPISDGLKGLLMGLLVSKERRLDIAQVRAHPFFRGVDWANLRAMAPPYVPKIRNEDDISNFVDTEFTPDQSCVDCGFRDFVGFTYDPHCTDAVVDSILQGHGRAPERCARASCRCDGEAPRSAAVALDSALSDEQRRLAERVALLGCEREQKETMLAKYNESLEGVLDQLVGRKEELQTVDISLQNAKKELGDIKHDIASKIKTLNSLCDTVENRRYMQSSQLTTMAVMEELADVKRLVDRAGFRDSIDRLKSIAYWMYKENCQLRRELATRALDADVETRSTEDLKKQLRIRRTEIREYQQKLDQEITGRRKLEEQLWELKHSLKNTAKQAVALTFTVTNVMNNKELAIAVGNNTIRVAEKEGGAQALVTEYAMGNVYIRELNNNELHHLTVKKRALCVKLFFLGEVARSCSSGTRRSLKALEKDLEKETKILEGLQRLTLMLDGATLKDVLAQRAGSEKKLKELQGEIERAKKCTITEYEVNDNENVAEFNNHLFYEKTVSKGTLCDHCNEVVFGHYKQAYVCKDCLLTVHKQCYILIGVSCELNRAMAAGQSIVVQCRTTEEKEKFIKMNQLY
ncbi:hypothetical protein PAPHI01_1578 [Pancytospora philotis]|nr:hypothetical protein PAPHI01_1578 [Pancytospora philotis]